MNEDLMVPIRFTHQKLRDQNFIEIERKKVT